MRGIPYASLYHQGMGHPRPALGFAVPLSDLKKRRGTRKKARGTTPAPRLPCQVSGQQVQEIASIARISSARHGDEDIRVAVWQVEASRKRPVCIDRRAIPQRAAHLGDLVNNLLPLPGARLRRLDLAHKRSDLSVQKRCSLLPRAGAGIVGDGAQRIV
jgi:hypothetical protein